MSCGNSGIMTAVAEQASLLDPGCVKPPIVILETDHRWVNDGMIIHQRFYLIGIVAPESNVGIISGPTDFPSYISSLSLIL